MTLQDLIQLIGENPRMIIGYYLIVIAISIISALFVNRENFKSPITYLFSTLIYAVSIPGIISVILIVYSAFIRKINFLEVNLLSYLLPIISMILVFTILNKSVTLKRIPGFRNIMGLFLMIGGTFFISYLIQKMFIGVIFIGGIQTLLLVFIVVFVLIKIGWNKMVK